MTFAKACRRADTSPCRIFRRPCLKDSPAGDGIQGFEDSKIHQLTLHSVGGRPLSGSARWGSFLVVVELRRVRGFEYGGFDFFPPGHGGGQDVAYSVNEGGMVVGYHGCRV